MLESLPIVPRRRSAIRTDAFRSMLEICHGQDLDLQAGARSLAEYQVVVERKSVAAYEWVATVGAEYFFIAAPGVVNPILDGQNLFQMEVVLYGMLIIGAVGLLFSKAAQYFENYNLRWRQDANK